MAGLEELEEPGTGIPPSAEVEFARSTHSVFERRLLFDTRASREENSPRITYHAKTTEAAVCGTQDGGLVPVSLLSGSPSRAVLEGAIRG